MRQLAPVVAVVAVVAFGANLGIDAAVAARSQARYATVRQLCAAPKPGGAMCLALALVAAPAGAPGARPRELGAGALSSGPAGGLTPAELASAYSFSPAAGGSGQTVAIVDAFDDPNIEADLATFDGHYGLAPCTTSDGCLEKVNQSGAATPLPAPDTAGWSAEISLDVETVHSVCPACRILLVEASSEGFADLAAAADEAVKLGASEVSNSYGGLETSLGEPERAAYDHPGVVVAAAAGDSGYLNWDDIFEVGFAPGLALAPASLPSVVAVGGTSLHLKAGGARKKESVWNDNGRPSHEREFKRPSATGGGCSTLSSAPAWQLGAPGWASAVCGTMRLDNDISAVADPYTGFDIYDSYAYEPSFTTGWLTIGGTSLSAPLISALYGLAGGAHGASYPAATLYAHVGQPTALYDVTRGGNGYCDGEEPGPCGEPTVNELLGELDCSGTTACDAAPGYDGPSGVGAPIGLAAFGAGPQSKPTVVTEAASSVEATSALLNATVDPNGELTSCSFEYGPTTAYGASVPCSSLPAPGTSPVAVSALLAGLTAHGTYHFRITAANALGVSTGKGRKFATP